MSILLFHVYALSSRGSNVALYDYAHYLEKYTSMKSMIMIDRYDPSCRTDVIMYEKFKRRFPIVCDNIHDIHDIRAMYAIIHGGLIHELEYYKQLQTSLNNLPLFIHCVFEVRPEYHVSGRFHLSMVSQSLAMKYHWPHYLPHILAYPTSPYPTFPKPPQSIIIGRHGGLDTFNWSPINVVMLSTLNKNPHVHFWFMWGDSNTHPPHLPTHERIRHFPMTTDKTWKERFIKSCDAMIVPETLGHTFGLSIAEFANYHKPIFCLNTPTLMNRCHLDILGQQAIYFTDEIDCIQQLQTWIEKRTMIDPYQQYQSFRPKNILHSFENQLLSLQYPSTSC